MSEEHSEPGELTERFRAFAESADPAPSRALPVAMMVAGMVAVVALALVVWLLLPS